LLVLVFSGLIDDRTALADSSSSGGLSKADRDYLDSLFDDFLFDPSWAERVRVKLPERRGFFSKDGTRACDAWLVKGSKGKPDRIYFVDSFRIPAPPADRIERIDFVAQIKKFFDTPQPSSEETGPWVEKTASEILGDSDSFLQFAAWLYRLGHVEYAAKCLGIARTLSSGAYSSSGLRFSVAKDDPRESLVSSLACQSFRDLIDDFTQAADELALGPVEFRGLDRSDQIPH
jgi:hypothetical protein